MIEAVGTVEIAAPARVVVATIRDIDRYCQIDVKMRRVLSIAWDGDDARLRFLGRLRHLPSPPVTVDVHIDGDRAIDVASTPGAFASRFVRFHGSYRFDELATGRTLVHHRQVLEARGPLRFVMEPYLRQWHQDTTDEQLANLKAAVEVASAA